MGSNYHVYVGPYIQYKESKIIAQFPYKECSNPECQEKIKEDFCGKCGSKAVTKYMEGTRDIWLFSELSKNNFDDELVIQENRFLIPNVNYGGKSMYFDDLSNSEQFIIHKHEIDESLKEFGKFFNKWVDFLDDLLREGKLKDFQVKYGAISYWN